MAINVVVAVTDYEWFSTLRQQHRPTEVNFWSPSAKQFRSLQPGELFLFKLHSPHNMIVGGGIFAHSNILPCYLAWQSFGTANGAQSLEEMELGIAKYRTSNQSTFEIGCRILTQPFFFDEPDWIGPMTGRYSHLQEVQYGRGRRLQTLGRSPSKHGPEILSPKKAELGNRRICTGRLIL